MSKIDDSTALWRESMRSEICGLRKKITRVRIACLRLDAKGINVDSRARPVVAVGVVDKGIHLLWPNFECLQAPITMKQRSSHFPKV